MLGHLQKCYSYVSDSYEPLIGSPIGGFLLYAGASEVGQFTADTALDATDCNGHIARLSI